MFQIEIRLQMKQLNCGTKMFATMQKKVINENDQAGNTDTHPEYHTDCWLQLCKLVTNGKWVCVWSQYIYCLFTPRSAFTPHTTYMQI